MQRTGHPALATRAGLLTILIALVGLCLAAAGCVSSGGDGGDGSASSDGSVSLSWAPVRERENGERLRPGDIDRYEVAYGTRSGEYMEFVNSPDTEERITGLEAGQRYYFVVRAYDSEGRPSAFSEELAQVAD